MNETLVIGSTVVDVSLNLPFLPRRGEDINISAPEYRIGGCAYNVYRALKLLSSPVLLCSPVGSGVHGSMVKEQFMKEGLVPIASLEEENGCCYCLIEPDGERTFLSHHGAEYLFYRSWMESIDFSGAGTVYVSGLELEESTNDEIVSFVCEHPELELHFSPGPRIMYIPAGIMERLMRRRGRNGRGPVLHLNETEALSIAGGSPSPVLTRSMLQKFPADGSGRGKIEAAAEFLARKTENSVIVTLGERGCYCLERAGMAGNFIPGFPAQVIDTVGAGDAHCGSLIACLKEGMGLEDACLRANRIGAAVVGVPSAVLDRLPEGFPG